VICNTFMFDFIGYFESRFRLVINLQQIKENLVSVMLEVGSCAVSLDMTVPEER